MKPTTYLLLIGMLILSTASCTIHEVDKPDKDPEYRSENVIVVIMDGARYSETAGYTTHSYTPFLSDTLAKEGVVCTKMYNDGITFTLPGHAAITTGFYQDIVNDGSELPIYPSIFQHWLKESGNDSTKAWLITSKDKDEILSNCKLSWWKDMYRPSFECGVNGNGTGYRDDSITIKKVLEVLEKSSPNLLFVSFKQPDEAGHNGNWDEYLEGIRKTDSYISQIYKYIRQDPIYSESTTLLITNDHGRHLDSIKDGFSSHGDDCDGCRHLSLWAYGKNIKQNFIDSTTYDLRDITSTVSGLLGIKSSIGDGEFMGGLFE